MARAFEDALMEIQTEMVQLGVDLAERATKKADRIYILCYFDTTYSVFNTNIFFKVGNRILHNGQMGFAEENDGSLDVFEEFFDGEDDQMMALKELFEDHGRPVPYVIRLVYDLVTEEFEAEYGYEPVVEETLDDDLYDAWMAEEQAKYPSFPPQQRPAATAQQPKKKGFLFSLFRRK